MQAAACRAPALRPQAAVFRPAAAAARWWRRRLPPLAAASRPAVWPLRRIVAHFRPRRNGRRIRAARMVLGLARRLRSAPADPRTGAAGGFDARPLGPPAGMGAGLDGGMGGGINDAAAAPMRRRLRQGATLSIIYQGEKVGVTKDRFVIGRGKQSSDLTLKDPNVSRQHAMIEYQNGVYFMVDMGSTNGVEYNGQRIARKQIAEGDVFRICDHDLRFTYR